jgi:small subunit ribosomal protein S16
MLTIRLQRAGKKNKADYRVVLAEKTAASQKKFTEVLGSYNPHTKALNIRNPERLNYWVDEQHVELSATVRNLFVTNNLIKGDKTKAFTIPKKEVVAEEAPATEVAEAIEENAPAAVETPQTEAESAAEAEAPAETPVPVEEPAAEEKAE